MEHFRLRPLSEADIDAVITAAGGRRAHEGSDRRAEPSADYLLGSTLIELKTLDDEGIDKPMRQAKLASLFRRHHPTRPVIVLDRAALPGEDQRTYDRILEGPIKGAIRSARRQLKQSRREHPGTQASILFVLNNGYTALDHDELVKLVAHRARNDTAEIDGIVVAGCYFYSDTFDSYFLWPIDYVPIDVQRPFGQFNTLRQAWNDCAERSMTAVVRGEVPTGQIKGPVIDAQFDVEAVTYVKPAPPLGNRSEFFVKGRPRANTSGIELCPVVATTFPQMTRAEWENFRSALGEESDLLSSYHEWQAQRNVASRVGTALKPFVPMEITFEGWRDRCERDGHAKRMSSVRSYANEMFDKSVRATIERARDRLSSTIVPSRYVLALTEEIGQDRANDVSDIICIIERSFGEPVIWPLVEDARIFHEYALVLACAYAVREGIESVLWQRDQRRPRPRGRPATVRNPRAHSSFRAPRCGRARAAG